MAHACSWSLVAARPLQALTQACCCRMMELQLSFYWHVRRLPWPEINITLLGNCCPWKGW